jgi:hypothetical protein
MRRIYFVLLILLLLISSSGCGNQEIVSKVYTEADSILTLTLALQSRIGSAEIQRLHDFQSEINADIADLEGLVLEDTSITLYRELSNGLVHCMKACNQFHEEAYMLESSLREIMAASGEKIANMNKLEERLIYEAELYADLFRRTDSSLSVAILQAEIFYSLKPEIDKIKDQVKSP